MANEITLSLALSASKTGITSASFARGLSGILANMVGSFIAQDTILCNHLGNGAISGATNAFPIVITTTLVHGLTTGESVNISGVGGNTAANGTWTVTVLSTTTFSIPVVGNATYTSGGTWRTDPTLIPLGQVTQPNLSWFYNLDAANYLTIRSGNANIGSISGATNANPIVITTPIAHGLAAGTTVVITGVLGNTAANGTFTVNSSPAPTSTTFAIPIAGNAGYTQGGVWVAEPVTTAAYIQPGVPNVFGLDPLITPYGVANSAAVQLEYAILSL